MTSFRAVLIFSLVFPFFHAHGETPAQSQARSSSDCSQLLIGHLRENGAYSFLAWEGLPQQLSNRKSATLLIQIPLKGFSSPFTDLSHLGLTSDDQIDILAKFGTISDNSYFVVIRGSGADLLRAHSLLAKRFFNANLTYQILESESTSRQFSLPTPTKLLELSNVSNPNLKEIETAALFDSSTASLAFLFPASALVGIPGKVAKLLGIRITKMDSNESLVNTLRSQQQNFAGKQMIRWNDVYLISATAFAELKKLEGRELLLNDENATVNVADTFLAALADELGHCKEPICEHAVPPKVIELIDQHTRRQQPPVDINAEVHSIQLSPEMYGTLPTSDADDLEEFLLSYHDIALPVAGRENEFRIIYFKRGESRQAYELVFRRLYSRLTKGVLEIVSMNRLNDSSVEKTFWKDLRAHLNLNSVVYPIDHELNFGGGYTQGIHISGNVLTKLIVKHRLTTEKIAAIIKGIRNASRSNTQDYVAHVELDGLQYDLFLTINNDFVHLKTLFRH